jgi:hypothetical protein
LSLEAELEREGDDLGGTHAKADARRPADAYAGSDAVNEREPA